MFQKRLNGSVDFYRGGDYYKRGYGNFGPAGFDKTRRLAKERSRLHVDPEDNDRKKTYAEYNFFGAASERSKYRLSL